MKETSLRRLFFIFRVQKFILDVQIFSLHVIRFSLRVFLKIIGTRVKKYTTFAAVLRGN